MFIWPYYTFIPRVKEMVQHLQAERVRLLGEVGSLEQSNESLKAQLAKAKERAQLRDQVYKENMALHYIHYSVQHSARTIDERAPL